MMHEEGIRCAIILTNLIVSEFIYKLVSIECLYYERMETYGNRIYLASRLLYCLV